MTLPKLIILDRDSTLNFSSSNPESPFYYITKLEHLILKPGVEEAVKLIEAHGIPMVLATRQRGISKGLVSSETVDLINTRLQRLLDVSFEGVYIETEAEDKVGLLKHILLEHRRVGPSNMVLFDDSPREVVVAQGLGINAFDGSDLLSAAKALFHIS